jgi:hypothetical protein
MYSVLFRHVVCMKAAAEVDWIHVCIHGFHEIVLVHSAADVQCVLCNHNISVLEYYNKGLHDHKTCSSRSE